MSFINVSFEFVLFLNHTYDKYNLATPSQVTENVRH